MASGNFPTPGTVANCELDTHADTCVAGPNFRIDEYTGEYCDVTPFSNDYKPTTNIPIVNASTAFPNEKTGETVILRFNQVLWYGTKLAISLINPNQIRHNGLTVSDDPTDNNRFFGITSDEAEIPFETKGTIVFFKSRSPTRWEMENCKVLEMTLDSPWNPGEVQISGAKTTNRGFDMELFTRREVCSFQAKKGDHVCKSNCECVSSDLGVFDQSQLIS